MSGRGFTWRAKQDRAKAYNEYRAEHEMDIDRMKKIVDDENEEINGEWFGDGKWELNDEQADIEEEDWEVWDDWFPPEDEKQKEKKKK
jgi:hypothetical protein